MKQGKPEPEDWIIYLSSLVSTNINISVVLFSAIILIFVVIYQIFNSGTINSDIIKILGFFEFIIAVVFLLRYNRARKYEDIIHKIMIGEIKTDDEILKEYKKVSKFRKKKKGIGIIMSFKESINSFLGHLKKSIELMIVALAGGFLGAVLTAYANLENPTGEGLYLVLLMFGFCVLFIAVMLFFIDYVTKKK